MIGWLGGQIPLYIVVKVTSFFEYLSTKYNFVCQQFCCEAVRAILDHSYLFAAKQYPDKAPLWNDDPQYPFWSMHVGKPADRRLKHRIPAPWPWKLQSCMVNVRFFGFYGFLPGNLGLEEIEEIGYNRLKAAMRSWLA